MDNFVHSLVSIPPPFNMIVLVVLIGSIAGVIGKIVVQARIYASHRADVHFKRELVERGLSAEEIERVVSAKAPRERRANDD